MTSQRIELPSIFEIGQVTETKPLLLDALGSGSDLELDGRPVQRTDAAAVQLLTSFFVEAARRDQRVTWAGVSEPLFEATHQLGLQHHLHLPEEASA